MGLFLLTASASLTLYLISLVISMPLWVILLPFILVYGIVIIGDICD